MNPTDSPSDRDRLQLAQAVREACIRAALAGYDDAAMSGLCAEGAWEAAVSAMQRLDLRPLAAPENGTPPPARSHFP